MVPPDALGLALDVTDTMSVKWQKAWKGGTVVGCNPIGG